MANKMEKNIWKNNQRNLVMQQTCFCMDQVREREDLRLTGFGGPTEHPPGWRLDIGLREAPCLGPAPFCEAYYSSSGNLYLTLLTPEPHIPHPKKTSSSPSPAGRNPVTWTHVLSLTCGVFPLWILSLCFAELSPLQARGALTGCLAEVSGTRPVNT